ncbi:MAG TPA: M14 family metallopeptidase [Thermoanaerobaculia bacterium]|nr:M14 family metallopeptidase [Thermoanaerobaculia bacterium]
MRHLLPLLLLLPSVAAAQDDWSTPAEIANFEATPSHMSTIIYLQLLDLQTPEMQISSFGESARGLDMPLVVVSKDQAFTPAAALRTGKPIVMIQNGIHAGEIDGKDACLMILRDLSEGLHRELLDKMILVVLPIYNVDGHERVSPYNRPNQDGPRQGMGFRTTAAGLDLNRDHLKAASPEAQALMKLVSDWRPHLHVDDHVTDGVDHDWVLTWSWAEAPQAPLPVDLWLREHMPAVLAATEKAGHRVGPYVDLKDGNDPGKGFSSWVGPPRYATGYYPLRNRPSILVEMHSYKPYKQRVLANRDFLLSLLREVARDPDSLLRAVSDAEDATVALGRPNAKPSTVTVVYDESEAADTIRFPVYAHEITTSAATGAPLLHYRRGQVQEMEVPWYHRPKVAMTLPRPRGYLVPPGWPQIEQRLRAHGLRAYRVRDRTNDAGFEMEVETIRVSDPKFAERAYQGLHRVEAKVERRTERRHIPDGAIWIPADQPDFEVAVQLFEPEAPDSLLSWGLLSSVFEQKEYIDSRVLEELAAEMIKDPKTAADFQEAMKDEKLAKDPFARYQWWYRRTPYWDETIGLLPVYRVMQAPKFKTEPGL